MDPRPVDLQDRERTLRPAPPGRWRRATRRVAWVAGGLVAAWAALTVAVRAAAPAIPAVDADVHAWALSQRDDVTVEVARVVSWFGQTNVALPLVLVAGIAAAAAGTRAFGRLRAGLVLLGVGALGVVLGLTLNAFVGRERPPVTDWAGDAGGFSFPSGHTTAATVAAGLMAWAITRRVRDRRVAVAVWGLAVALAVAVGWSRVWLGVHWPLDVLCAWLFAASVLVGARAVQLRWWPEDAPPVPVRGEEAS